MCFNSPYIKGGWNFIANQAVDRFFHLGGNAGRDSFHLKASMSRCLISAGRIVVLQNSHRLPPFLPFNKPQLIEQPEKRLFDPQWADSGQLAIRVGLIA